MKDYKKILEGVYNIISTTEKSDIGFANICSYIGENCPELKESEDEKIKKELIDAVQGLWDNDALPMPLSEKRKDAWIVYLEKQGEKDKLIKELGEYKVKYTQEILSQQLEKQGIKPQGKSALEAIHEQRTDNANKVERKFKVGDYIVNDYCKGKVIELTTDAYLLDTEQGIPFSYEHNAHIWSIQDAKDGDILVDVYGNIGIFQKNYDFDWMSYCSLGINGGFQNFEVEHENEKTYPATKEQRDLFFQKMKEAGCRWNSTEKKLEKIEGGKESESKKEKRTYSTEECNCIIQDTISICEQARKNATNEIDYENTTRCIGWLKSLKLKA